MPGINITLLTLFPEMAHGFLGASMIGRAVKNGVVGMAIRDLRDWTTDRHRTADDRPFGGGAGMLLKPEPIFEAFDELKQPGATAIYMAPDGEPLTTSVAKELAGCESLLVLSGHYEGVDERVREALIDREISIGDYVLTNGVLPACVMIDALCRHVPGVLGEEKSLTQDSFNDNLLSFPQYTRPAEYRGMRVPEPLLSGNHGEIERWRNERRLEKTRLRRPDLQGAKDNDSQP